MKTEQCLQLQSIITEKVMWIPQYHIYLQFDAPNDLFAKRELDIIFWAQQRLSAKEIAKRLNLSPRTVENNLQFIYEKAGVYSIIQFVEYCKQTGLDSYIPSDFIRRGIQLIE